MALGQEIGLTSSTTGAGRQPVRERSASEVSPEAASDASLVIAAQNGDRTAFGRLYDLYARMVHGVLLSKVPRDAVDDLVQDVFMTALRRLSTLRDARSFAAWLAAIARNLANDYHRRAGPEDQLSNDGSDGAEEISNQDESRPAAEVLAVIRSLPDAYSETLILRLVEGMTGPEIAARTGMTHGSVRVNLHRGMQQLREKLSSKPKRSLPEQEKQ
jgi:RNA polymerase sigma-70 factor (ECF subfamily)